jgi:hypothetical protein
VHGLGGESCASPRPGLFHSSQPRGRRLLSVALLAQVADGPGCVVSQPRIVDIGRMTRHAGVATRGAQTVERIHGW